MRVRKNKEYLFVDGYNIINSWQRLKAIKDVDFEGARDKLIDILAEYKHYSEIEIILVFDAHLVTGNMGTVTVRNGLEVVYTKEGETADHYIERKLDEIGKIRKVRVATSDWIEQQIILGRGGTRISARELEIEIFESKKILSHKEILSKGKNDFSINQLDQKTIDKLNKWMEDNGEFN